MEGFGPTSFGTLNAADYDRTQDPGTTPQAVDLLTELAGHGRVLELAIGTGRVAIPMAQRGVRIEGLDASAEMIAEMRKKPGADTIPAVVGDMEDVPVEGPFDFAFLIFNTLFNLMSQEAQVRCFQNTAARLAPGGAFLIEAFVPDVTQFTKGRSFLTQKVDYEGVVLEAAVHHPVTQTVDYHYIRITRSGINTRPLVMRYAWPCEIDLMARLAGLTLESRWGGWDRTPFTAQSQMHVSLYRKPS